MLVLALALGGVGAASASPLEPTARFPKGTARMDLGPAPADVGTWDTAACVQCHPREGAAWARSGHAVARSGFVFQAALAREDPTWCVSCHAPLAGRTTGSPVPEQAPPEEHGIPCAACHAVGPGAAADDAIGYHAAGMTQALDDPATCAGCHQFGFRVRDGEGRLVRLASMPQQDTWGEWTRWRDATGDSRTCVTCHFRGGDHSLGGRRRNEALRDALDVRRAGPRTLEIRTRDVGHSLPTGDVMRWIYVEAAADASFEEPITVAALRRTLVIRLRPPEPRPCLGLDEDTTLPASGTGTPLRVTFPERDPAGRPLTVWRVVYHLVSEAQEADEMIPAGLSRIVVTAGPIEEVP